MILVPPLSDSSGYALGLTPCHSKIGGFFIGDVGFPYAECSKTFMILISLYSISVLVIFLLSGRLLVFVLFFLRWTASFQIGSRICG
jgi:hypothetical protein